MSKTVAVLGAGRMGTFFCGQLPEDYNKIVIDTDTKKARDLAEKIGARYGAPYQYIEEADIIAVILPAPAIVPVSRELAPLAKDGAIIFNMATGASIEQSVRQKFPNVHFVDAQIIGHARSLTEGAPAIVVLDTRDEAVCEAARQCMRGYGKVLSGDAALVSKTNKIGSSEGIATAIKVKKQLEKMQLPEDWIDVVIYTVCAGTMRSYVRKDLGEFAQELAEKLENESE